MIEGLSSVSGASFELTGGASGVSETRYQAQGPSISGEVEQPSFTEHLSQVANNAVDRLKAGEAASISGIQGKASAQEVVEAVMSAELTLQSALAIRDKVVSAYQEVSRMAI